MANRYDCQVFKFFENFLKNYKKAYCYKDYTNAIRNRIINTFSLDMVLKGEKSQKQKYVLTKFAGDK